MKILHTADWQIGKPYARIEDPDKRAMARRVRIESIDVLARLAREEGVDLVLVAGDLFDSPTVEKSAVSAVMSALGRFERPLVVIPGNHDHGGPGSIWHQEFFRQEREALAPNVRVLLQAEAVEVADAVIFACPLTRRSEPTDTTAWLRSAEAFGQAAPGKCRIVLAHGATQSFGATELDDEDGHVSNLIDLGRLPESEIDYVALGDWHGTKQVGPKAWYAGTHEQDRFPKGEGYEAGNALIVEVARGQAPHVRVVSTGRLDWARLAHTFHEDADVERFEADVSALLGTEVDRHLLQITLRGALGLEASRRLDELLERIRARVIRLKLDRRTTLQPDDAELAALTQRQADPLIAQVARRLVGQAEAGGQEAELARAALQELYHATARASEV